MCVDLSLGFLFCSIDLYFCLCASTILSWWLWLCSRAWSQPDWSLQFHSSFSRLLWLFEFCFFFCISIQIVKLFVLLLLLSHFSHIRLCVTPYTAAHQAPQSLGCSRQEHWSGLPFPSQVNESEKWKWSHSVMSDPQRPHRIALNL